MLAMIAAPSLFQVWLTLGVMSVATLILALHGWHREESGPPAWRAFLTLLGADTILLLGLIVIVYKLGTTMGLEDRSRPASAARRCTTFGSSGPPGSRRRPTPCSSRVTGAWSSSACCSCSPP